ncbi:MAG TPA: dihydroxyacetone kinase subunit DhaL [Paracoccaceae bacterium]|nr:dihydroxyacetone kinase subunit DhaL [Paracoccaceae bacterium]
MTQGELIRTLVSRAWAAISAHAEELTRLDQAIGDGDHGLNMARGFSAVAEAAESLAALPFGEALRKAGMTLVLKIGGASGPLYGSLLMDMGKVAQAVPNSPAEVARLLAAGVQAVKARGKSDAGAKTMLDVLIPVLATLEAGGGAAEARQAADAGLEATRPMRATKGRAAFLGERSIGHLDPGARSAALLVHVACDIAEGT